MKTVSAVESAARAAVYETIAADYARRAVQGCWNMLNRQPNAEKPDGEHCGDAVEEQVRKMICFALESYDEWRDGR